MNVGMNVNALWNEILISVV